MFVAQLVGQVQVAIHPVGAAIPQQLWALQGQLDWHNSPASCPQPSMPGAH